MKFRTWILPLAALAAVALAVINEAAYKRSTDALGKLGQRAEARGQIQLLWRALVDAETGQRGYLITGRSDNLALYLEAAETAQHALAWLNRHYQGDPQVAPVLADLANLGLGKLSELATTLELHAAGRSEAWRDILLTDIGREKMDGLRQASQQLLEIETTRVFADRSDIIRTLQRERIGVSAMAALSLLALMLFLRQTLAFERTQSDQAEALQAQRDRLEAEVSRRTADLTELARHLQSAREDEKSRLARELHDELGAVLTAAKLDAARLKRAIGPMEPGVDARLLHLNESINTGIELKRRIIEELRPSSLSNLGLTAALDILVREFASRSEAKVTARLDSVVLSDSAQITVFRLMQEALANASRHAAATQILVTLEASDRDPAGTGKGSAHVVVQDDGRGFNTALRRGTTHGLMGLGYRIEAEQGEMEVHSTPGSGTRVEAWLPLRTEALAETGVT
jgi:signal transduction histidine kinase